jgi:uncharacterized protein (TIGR02453 family)
MNGMMLPDNERNKRMSIFSGFPEETVRFYQELARHNNRDWFEAHKQDYKTQVLKPAQQFVLTMGERLQTVAPELVIDSRTTGSGAIFRIYRDTRFSPDKTPYKTFLGIWWWEGLRPKNENSGFYFQLEPEKLYLAVGIYILPPPLLKLYRDAVVHPELGIAVAHAVKQVTAIGVYQIGGIHYKRPPRGYDANHPNARFLLHNGLYAFIEDDIPRELSSEALVEYCSVRFHEMAPIHHWLVKVLR